jgi:hypothetical protein
MAWPAGKSKLKTGGRKKGTPNKRTTEFLKILEEQDFCPTRALITSYRKAMKAYASVDKAMSLVADAKDTEERLQALGIVANLTANAPTNLSIAQRAAAELLQYAQPKRKAIEFKPPGEGDENAGGVIIFMPSNGREAKKAKAS